MALWEEQYYAYRTKVRKKVHNHAESLAELLTQS